MFQRVMNTNFNVQWVCVWSHTRDVMVSPNVLTTVMKRIAVSTMKPRQSDHLRSNCWCFRSGIWGFQSPYEFFIARHQIQTDLFPLNGLENWGLLYYLKPVLNYDCFMYWQELVFTVVQTVWCSFKCSQLYVVFYISIVLG